MCRRDDSFESADSTRGGRVVGRDTEWQEGDSCALLKQCSGNRRRGRGQAEGLCRRPGPARKLEGRMGMNVEKKRADQGSRARLGEAKELG